MSSKKKSGGSHGRGDCHHRDDDMGTSLKRTKGDDVLLYSMAGNLGADFADIGAHDLYDGGSGFDTLRLTLTYGEVLLDSVQEDIAAFHAFLATKANPRTEHGKIFEFASFDLDVLVVKEADATSLMGAEIPVDADGTVTYDPAASLLLQQLAEGAAIVGTFSYTIADLAGATATATAEVTVTGVNDTPTVANDSVTLPVFGAGGGQIELSTLDFTS